MTLDEAIKHCEEVAEELRNVDMGELDTLYCGDTECIEARKNDCIECANEHRQLAEWLKELKQFKEQEYCEDCISRQAVLEAFGLSEKTRKYGGDHNGYDTLMKYEIQDILEALPPVTPEPKMGKWIRLTDDLAQCSNCGDYIDNAIQCGYNFCPNCGAEMEGVEG